MTWVLLQEFLQELSLIAVLGGSSFNSTTRGQDLSLSIHRIAKLATAETLDYPNPTSSALGVIWCHHSQHPAKVHVPSPKFKGLLPLLRSMSSMFHRKDPL